MSDPSIRNPDYRPLTHKQLLDIDGLSDRFDQELLNEGNPRIETFLAAAPEAARGNLLPELLAMEIEHRTRQGHSLGLGEYIQRFPGQEQVIVDLFKQEESTQIPNDGAGSESVNAPPVLANFRPIEEIGRGGMGVVWLAEQVEPVRRRVALKLIKFEQTSKDVLARFEAEKQALAMMDHPNIARVLDAGATEDARPYFVMELVDGIPITQYCDDNKLSVDERLNLFVPVCKAVQHAHQKGIIHRDLKPSNVLVAEVDGEAIPKVIDFGLAKAVEQNLQLSDLTMQTEFGKVVGTVQYMSPEQAELKGVDTEDIDTRTDVYSLGVMLYELMTGSTPVDEETLGQNALLKVLQIVREEDPPRPSSRLSSSSNEVTSAVSDRRSMHPARLRQLLHGELDWVVMRALEKEPNRRYQTANDLAQDLSNYLTGEAVVARPPSTWYQAQKFARRNRGLVASLVAIGIALVGGIAGTTYGLIKANTKAELAETEQGRAQRNEERAVEAERLASASAQRARDAQAASQFQLANARWDAGRAGRARELLGAIAPEYRDSFEWKYCARMFNGSDLTCYGIGNDLRGVAFSPDGRRIATGDLVGRLKLWDAQTGQELASLSGHQGPANEVVFSPDGSLIAAAGPGGCISIWESTTLERLATLDGDTNSVIGIGFRADGRQLVSVSCNATIKRWDVQSGREVATLDGNEAVRDVSFSLDSSRFVFCATSGLAVRETLSGRNISMQPNSIRGATSVAISPDGMHVAVGSHDAIELWTADLTRKLWVGYAKSGWIRDLKFSPDGTHVVSAGESEGHLQIWDVRSGSKVRALVGNSGPINGIDFSPGGERLATGSSNTRLRLWDLRSGQKAISLRAHHKIILGLAYSHDNARITSFAADGTVKLWDVETCLETASVKVLNADVSSRPSSTDCVTFSPDDAYIAVVGADHTVKILDGKTGTEQKTLAGHSDRVNGVSFGPKGKWLVSAGQDHDVKVWDVESGEEVSTMVGHTGPVISVAFSPDGNYIASAGEDATVRLWDAQSFRQIHSLEHHRDHVLNVTFSPDGKRLASAGNEPMIYTWEVETGKLVSQMRSGDGGIVDLEYSPDSRRLVSTGYDRSMKLWDTDAAQELLSVEADSVGLENSPGGRTHRLHGLAFSFDGQQIAVGSDHGIIHLLDAPNDCETLTLSGHRQRVTELTFSEDGRRIYSAANEERLVWDLATTTHIPDADWAPPLTPSRISPDNRWLIYSELNKLILVDLENSNTPAEKRYRALKARFDPMWHRARAEAAAAEKNWYAATFHFALLAKNEPDTFQGELLWGLQELKSEFDETGRDMESHLATVVKESQSLPEDSGPPNASFERPRIRERGFELHNRIPRWKTTSDQFEIWSKGFQSLEAHDGNQFVELNANEEGTLYQDFPDIKRNDLIEFSFAHRGRNGDDTLRMTITDLGSDDVLGGDNDIELFSKEFTTGNHAWAVYNSTTEPRIEALGNTLRFAFTAVSVTGGNGPENTEGNFLDAAEFGVGVLTTAPTPMVTR